VDFSLTNTDWGENIAYNIRKLI